MGSLWIQVKIDVKINEWFGVFYDMIQKALATPNAVTIEEYFASLLSFITLAGIYVALYVVISFFTAHYLFRWRTAMVEWYHSVYDRARTIEGASQRVQEDTIKFTRIMEGLGTALIESVMVLVQFIPILFGLSMGIPIFFFGGKQFKGKNENRLIGYYKKAIVYRKSQRLPVDMVTHEKNQLKYYRFKAKAEDVVLLKQVDRTTKFSPTTQSQWCFTPKKYINVVKNISFSKGSIEKNSPRKSGRKNTPYLQRIEVERKAVALTITHYEEFGYEYIKSVESENCGYDLEIGKGKGKLCVEVKGRGQQSPDITLTPNEYKYFKERKKNYRLVIVTGCMTDEPKIFICKFKDKKLIVINNQEMSVVGKTVESFRLQIN